MQRRVFIAKLIQWLKGAGLVIFMPVFMNPKMVNAGHESFYKGRRGDVGHSIREDAVMDQSDARHESSEAAKAAPKTRRKAPGKGAKAL